MAQHFIYRITHKQSGKRYVGRTVDVLRRWKEHCWSWSTSPISCAIRKHGVDAFEFEVIASTDDDERVKELEEWWIFLHDCLVPRGYNLLATGDGNTGHAPESRAQMSAAHTGKVLSEETRARMSTARLGPLNPNFGVTMSVETRRKIGEKSRMRGGLPVVQYTPEGDRMGSFHSCQSAAESFGGDANVAEWIGMVCSRQRGTAGGFMWRYSDGAPPSLPPHVPTPPTTRSVQQLRDGELVKTFSSIKEAAAAVGAKEPNISAVLAGRGRTCSGFGWRYEDGGVPKKRTVSSNALPAAKRVAVTA